MPDELNQPLKARRARPTAMALVMGLAALTAQAGESDVVHDIQRYCTACWRNAKLDPGLWDDCTQEVCCRLLGKARGGQLDLNLVLAEDTPERRELVRAIDMVRKRVQRTRKFQTLDAQTTLGPDVDRRNRERQELGELLENARRAVLSDRQDRDRGDVDPRLDRARNFRHPQHARHPSQRRKVQGPAEVGATPGQSPRGSEPGGRTDGRGFASGRLRNLAVRGNVMNSIMVIHPYKTDGVWAFDDPKVGLLHEPFVCGADTIIEQLVEPLIGAESGFTLLFSARPFPGYQAEFEWLREDMGGNWYSSPKHGLEGWLCPALFRYFDQAPFRIYVQAKPKVG